MKTTVVLALWKEPLAGFSLSLVESSRRGEEEEKPANKANGFTQEEDEDNASPQMSNAIYTFTELYFPFSIRVQGMESVFSLYDRRIFSLLV